MDTATAAALKVHNFSAGPAILPQPVLAQAAQAVLDLGHGLSLLEISHRSPEFIDIMEEARALALELLGFDPEAYSALFLGGGATTQFFTVPYNLLPSTGTAHYLDTGTWSAKAIKEAKLFGAINVVASSATDNYTYIPTDYTTPTEGAYFHVTSNNTIFGTQLQKFPDSRLPLVCDMSSDIFSRAIPAERFGIVYAGAQKNMGPAGVTLVIVRKDLLGKVDRELPGMVDYRSHVKADSMFNTPPVFPVYVSLLTMRWVKQQGGVTAMQDSNEEKAAVLYAEIDRNPLFKGVTATTDRSKMNATFDVVNPDDTDAFLALCTERNIDALAGHRSVGGFRASMYNAMDLPSIEVLVEAMRDFERQRG